MKKVMRFIVLLCIVSTGNAYAQNPGYFSKNDFFRDLDYLVYDIETIHPNPYHSMNKEEFLSMIQQIRLETPDSMSRLDAFKRLNRVIVSLHEGHSFLRAPVVSGSDFPGFPYTVKMDQKSNSILVRGTVDGSSTEFLGLQILSINGIKTDSLISIFKESTSAENIPYLYYLNELHFDYAMYVIFGNPEYFSIEFNSGNKIIHADCKSLPSPVHENLPNYSFSLLSDSIGLIDMNSLVSLADFKKFARSTFKFLKKKKVGNLIIDFRGNTGGDSEIGDELLKYLSDKSFTQYQKAIAKVSSVSRELFNYPYEKDTIIEKDLSGNYIAPYPESDRFSGKVYLLINGGTFSSAGSTVWCIRHYQLAETIGSETGGTGVHYGYPIKRKLPVTGLNYSVSHIKWYQVGADDNSVNGLLPDYTVDESIDDIKNHRDSVLDYALRLINTN
jgi:hypothetical protein